MSGARNRLGHARGLGQERCREPSANPGERGSAAVVRAAALRQGLADLPGCELRTHERSIQSSGIDDLEVERSECDSVSKAHRTLLARLEAFLIEPRSVGRTMISQGEVFSIIDPEEGVHLGDEGEASDDVAAGRSSHADLMRERVLRLLANRVDQPLGGCRTLGRFDASRNGIEAHPIEIGLGFISRACQKVQSRHRLHECGLSVPTCLLGQFDDVELSPPLNDLARLRNHQLDCWRRRCPKQVPRTAGGAQR